MSMCIPYRVAIVGEQRHQQILQKWRFKDTTRFSELSTLEYSYTIPMSYRLTCYACHNQTSSSSSAFQVRALLFNSSLHSCPHLSQDSLTPCLYNTVQTRAMDSLIPFTTSGSLVDCVDSTSVTNIRTAVPPTHTTFMS